MKPRIKPSGVLELAALKLNLAPEPLIDAMFGMAGSRAVMAGQRLGIFAALARETVPAEALATALNLAPAPLAGLLNALTAAGYLRRGREGYRLARRMRKWLDPESPTFVGAFLEFNYQQWQWWSNLEEVVRTGVGVDIHAEGADSPLWEPYEAAMFQLARLSAPEVAARLRLPRSAALLLDLAGGHGWYAAALCARFQGMRAIVVDLPEVGDRGSRLIAGLPGAAAVKFMAGDILTGALPRDADAALCFQIIHHFTPEQNAALLKSVRGALKPGGTVAIMDYFEPEGGDQSDTGALLGLHFRITSGGRLYTRADLRGWMLQAGFSQPRFSRLHSVPIQVLVQARAI